MTLSVTIDDAAEATPPGGSPLATYDDDAATGDLILEVTAPTAHQHTWSAVNSLDPPTVEAWEGPHDSGQLVSVSATPPYDSDVCVNGECPFWDGMAQNVTQITGWSDGDAGGQFGYVDGQGQFQPSDDATLVTHYRCPILTNTQRNVRLSATADDIPFDTDPGTGQTVSTFDDDPAVGSADILVIAPHLHNWEARDNLPSPGLQLERSSVGTEEVVALQLDQVELADGDLCVHERCSFQDSTAPNMVQIAAWSDGGAGGTFGYVDGAGQFFEAQDPWLITHYRASNTAGSVSISVTVDDVPEATDPATSEAISTYDDAERSITQTLTVTGPPPPPHSWVMGATIATPEVTASSTTPITEAVISISASTQNEADHCTAEECPFPNADADNTVRVTGWSDGNAGGVFGYLDELNQFVASSDPNQITHYHCPSSSGLVTLTATADDVPEAAEPGGGSVVTFDDTAADGALSFPVYSPGSHVHMWVAGQTLEAPVLTGDVGNPTPDQLVALNVSHGTDADECTATDGCPFSGNVAENAVVISGWSDGSAGGSFGYLDGLGQFVPTTDPTLVTHYECPATPGAITLTVSIDDVAEATEPDSGNTVATYDDVTADGAFILDVTEEDIHAHDWEEENNLPEPDVEVGNANPEYGAVIAVRFNAPTDDDFCIDPAQLPCAFPNYVAGNALQTLSWSDEGAGGAFGYLDGAGEFAASTDVTLITHYRCPLEPPPGGGATTVNLHVTIDDIPQAQEIITGRTVATYNDLQATGARPLVVNGAQAHSHSWATGTEFVITGELIGPTSSPLPLQEIYLDLGNVHDGDLCTNNSSLQQPCSLLNENISDVVHRTWSDGNAGGSFGKYVGGQFQTCPGDEVTTYKCPSQPQWVNITVRLDDQASRIWNGQSQTLQQDGYLDKAIGFQVGATHVHKWRQLSNIPSCGMAPDNTRPGAGAVVNLRRWLSDDPEDCITPNCPIIGPPPAQIKDPVIATSWSAQPAGGDFGKIGINNQFTTCPAWEVTHYRCAQVGTTTTVELSMTVDDIPRTIANSTTPTTFNDTEVKATTSLTVVPSHSHDWEAVANISDTSLSASPTTITQTQVVQFTSDPGTDEDLCLKTTPVCPFPNNRATNTVVRSGWTASPAIGEFGRVTGGMFAPSSDPEQINAWRPPSTQTQPVSVTLTMKVKDIAQAPVGNTVHATYPDGEQSVSVTVQVQPIHVHSWSANGNLTDRPVFLYHLNGASALTAQPGEILRIDKGALVQDKDFCTVANCSFDDGGIGLALEVEIAGQTKFFKDNRGGKFGKLDERGKFFPLDHDDIDGVTHYQAPAVTGQDIVSLRVQDSALAQEGPDGGDGPIISTNPDGERDGTPAYLQISGSTACDLGPRNHRRIDTGDACGCLCKLGARPAVPAQSSIEPYSATVNFEVPVTGWTCRGQSLGLTLSYHSDAKADPSLDAPGSDPDVNAEPNLAHLSTRNARWTHSWAQFMEVVEDGEGGYHALWHTGDGGTVGFDRVGSAWQPEDSFNSLTSSGSSTTNLPLPRGYGGAAVSVMVTYGNFVATDGSGTRYEFGTGPSSNNPNVFWEKGKWTAIPYFLLKKVTDRFNREVTLTWNGNQLTRVTDGTDRGLVFNYGGRVLRSVTDPFGRTHNFSYRNFDSEWDQPETKLTGVTLQGPGSPNRVTHTWRFDYGTATGDLLTSKVEPSGKEVHYEYEAVDTGSDPPRQTFGDWDGRITRSYYADLTEVGRIKEFRREAVSASEYRIIFPEGNSQTFTYDTGGAVEKVTDDRTGGETHYKFDSFHNLKKVWTSWPGESETEPLLEIEYVMAPDNRTIKKSIVTGPYSATLGDRTETTFGTFNLPYRTETGWRHTGGAGYNQVGTVHPDDQGRPNYLTQDSNPVTQRLGSTMLKWFYDQPEEVVDPVGRVSKTVYDSVTGLPKESWSPPNKTVATNHSDYAASVSRVFYTEELPTLLRDPMGHETKISYNAVSSGASALEIKTTRAYDNVSQRAVLNADGQPIHMTDAAGVVTRIQYNGDGIPIRVIEAEGRAEQRITEYRYNLNGDLVELKNARGYSTFYEYTGHNQVGGQTTTEYTGRLTHIRYPDDTHEYFGYKNTGEVEWWMRPYRAGALINYCVVTYEYDDLHRLVKTNYPASPQSQGSFSVTTAYDEFGRVISVADASGTTSYGYDPLSRLTSVSPSANRKAMTLRYDADTVRNRWSVRTTLATVGTWEQREDSKGRTHEVINPFNQTFSFDYDRNGKLTRRTAANGTYTDYGYDWQDRLISLKHTASNSQVLDQFTYDYYANDRLWKETDTVGNVHQFGYDALGQLISETHPDLGSGNLYQYDGNGNRKQVTRNGVTEFYGVDVADKLQWISRSSAGPLTSQPYSVYAYDDLGQTVSRERYDGQTRNTLDFKWDSDGRLRSVNRRGAGGNLLSATYTADGQRVTKTDAQTGAHTYSFGLHDTDKNTIHTPGLAQRKGGSDRFYHEDWLGSTRYLTDKTGKSAPTKARYDAYGVQSARAGTDPATTTEFQFAGAHGYEREPGNALGLDYLHHRYYDPLAGRFITRDPIGYAGGFNLFAYVDNNPLGFVDPTGLRKDGDFVDFVAGFGDSLTFGATAAARKNILWMMYRDDDDGVDYDSTAYMAGEYTEIAVEIAVTGGSAAMKSLAKGTCKSVVRGEMQRELRGNGLAREIQRRVVTPHHKNPLYGHPLQLGGKKAVFPTAGLPAAIHSGKANIKLVTKGVGRVPSKAHLAEHGRLIAAERIGTILVNPLTTSSRFGCVINNHSRDHLK